MRSRRQIRLARQATHETGPARRRAKLLANSDLILTAEAISMNQMAFISAYITDGDIDNIEEALLHNDSLCAMLLEIRHRHSLGLR